MWFQIKVKKNWVEGPKHFLKQLSQVRALDEEVLKIVMPHVKSTAWNAHSEQILQTMLAWQVMTEKNVSLLSNKYRPFVD